MNSNNQHIAEGANSPTEPIAWYLDTPPPTIITSSFHSFEELAYAAKGWDVELVQTEAGEGGVDALITRSSQFHFLHLLFKKNNYKRGSAPKGFRTFTIAACPQQDYESHQQSISHNQIKLHPLSGGIDGVSYAGFNAFTLSIHENDMEQLSLMAGGMDLSEASKKGTVFTPTPESLDKLRQTLWSIKQLGTSNQLTQGFYPASQAAQAALASCLATSVEFKGFPPPNKRNKAFSKAIEHINDNLQSIFSIKDLCQIANVSERTLLYTFRERLGVTPKAYLQIFKLKRVQQELVCQTARNVTDAATKWGFWHMGQFAIDYKRQFGELPSTTFKRYNPLT